MINDFSRLLAPWLTSVPSFEIKRIVSDSRHVQPGDLFLAYPGYHSDGRLFISSALAQGARAVLYDIDDWPLDCPKPEVSSPCFPLSALKKKRGEIVSRFWDDPSHHMRVVGVTGTNGKTTVAYLLAQSCDRLKKTAHYLGTLGYGPVENIHDVGMTTPDTLALQSMLSEAYQSGVDYFCMEVSSHALDQHRVSGVHFRSAIFTNLTHDHLDYHKTFDHYAQAKAKLFHDYPLSYALINRDDPYYQVMMSSKTTCLTYGMNAACDIQLMAWKTTEEGSVATLRSPWGQYEIQTSLLGLFNLYNLLAVFGVLCCEGFSPADVVNVMALLQPSPGRMECVHRAPYVIVDYAHTPDALDHTLRTLSALKTGQLHVILGCGGDRDTTKRPIMGEIASRYADVLMITSDNPRTEDPRAIMQAIKKGITSDKVKVFEEIDREKAIITTLHRTEPRDIVIIAGKGHENYQQIGMKKHPFSDQLVVKTYYQRKP